MSRQRALGAESIVVENGRIVTPESVLEGAVRIEDDRIVDVGEVDRRADAVLDARGEVVMPGLIDLHGDDIETHLHPRSGARMDTQMALVSADRANVGAGITTKFHAIAFQIDREENRSPELAADLTAAIEGADDLVGDHRIHARCEVTQAAAVTAVETILAGGHADLVSVMSHVPGKGQFRDEAAFREYYRNSEKHTIDEAERMIEERSGLALETIRERIERVLAAAREHGVPTASHDDENPAEVEWLADCGVVISEYPITLATARRADDLGLAVTMGAPNLVRGESQWGNLRTAEAIEAGVVDALVADYHPPSLLAAAFVDTGDPLPRRVARVTSAPAAAAGLSDRGRIEPDARADLIVVDPEPTPTVSRALVAGQAAYRADPDAGGRR